MRMSRTVLKLALLLFVVVSPVILNASQRIILDANGSGRVFEGIGGLSAGASSRLLMEYPEPYRSYVLDYLFKPNFGAAFHHLKVEVGGNVNSTDGTEPSHAYTREELEKPCREYYERGYEWWLMKEAKKRNSSIYLDILPWGAPGWIGNGERFSQDMADYMVKFIKGADFFHNLKIDYAGTWNESGYKTDYIKLLRKALDAGNLGDVKIVAADCTGSGGWRIVDDLLKDKPLLDSIYAVGAHYPSMGEYYKGAAKYNTPDELKTLNVPMWSSEDGPWRGDWKGACLLAQMYNRNYVVGKMTKTVIWSIITSCYGQLPYGNAGIMTAQTPWSGYYEVDPAVWATAHTTQFAYPGWKYIDSGCGVLDKQGSYVTLRNPASADWSVIIETVDANMPQEIVFNIGKGLAQDKPVHVWRTNSKVQFEKIANLIPENGLIKIVVDPAPCIRSLQRPDSLRDWPMCRRTHRSRPPIRMISSSMKLARWPDISRIRAAFLKCSRDPTAKARH